MQRRLFHEEHDMYRASVRGFLDRWVTPFHADWENAGCVPRGVWRAAGAQGLLALTVPEEHGGPGIDDFRFSAVLIEELARAGATGPGWAVHSDIVVPYILTSGTAEQKARWLPGCVSGETITAIAMTEPGAGSDLAGIRTRAVRNGNGYILDGAKTFITNGQLADLLIVVARTGEHPHKGLSLFLVPGDAPGFSRGRNLEKIGMKAQDTSELHLDGVRVPAADLLGDEGGGFKALVRNLPQERLVIAVTAIADTWRAFELTLQYAKDRPAFGKPIGSFQHNRFVLAEIRTELEVAQAFLDRCIEAHLEGGLTAEEAAMAKWWTTELQKRTLDRCLQMHGGYGYMLEYPIARQYLDARAQTIYGGTTEIMKEIIGRSLGLGESEEGIPGR